MAYKAIAFDHCAISAKLLAWNGIEPPPKGYEPSHLPLIVPRNSEWEDLNLRLARPRGAIYLTDLTFR